MNRRPSLPAAFIAALLAGGCGGRAHSTPVDAAASALRGDPDADSDHDGYTPNQGDCDDANAAVHPGATEICNQIDDNCNGRIDEVCDYDLDTYTPDSGDCDDHDPLVNPGAFEVPGNGVDDNCNGRTDEPFAPCDGTDGRDATALAGALEICAPWLHAASVNSDSDLRARASRTSFGTYKPGAGRTLVLLDTGTAGQTGEPGFAPPDPGTEFENDDQNPLPMQNGANACGMVYSDEATVHDYVELKLVLRVPTNAQSFSFRFSFLSAEYPEFVGSTYNDKFLVILDSRAYRGNVSFDKAGNPVTVNVGFFAVCASEPICSGQRVNRCRTAVSELAGTGYELDDGTGQPIGGGTGWLTTTAPVAPGELATLRFVLFDEGDHRLDSTVAIDAFQWNVAPAPAPSTVQ